MTKSIEDRVSDSFGNDDRENISKYLDWARSTLVDYSQNNRRAATLLLVIVAIFELVAYSRNSSISIGSFVVTSGSVVLEFLPALVAYIFLQMMADFNRTYQLLTVFTQVFKLWSEKAEKNDLDNHLRGPAPLYWNLFGGYRRRVNSYRADHFESISSVTMILSIPIAITAFEAQAYYVLFTSSVSRLILSIISCCVALLCVVIGWGTFVAITTTSETPPKI